MMSKSTEDISRSYNTSLALHSDFRWLTAQHAVHREGSADARFSVARSECGRWPDVSAGGFRPVRSASEPKMAKVHALTEDGVL